MAIVQAGWGSRWIGRLELSFDAAGKLIGVTGVPILVGGPKSDHPVQEDATMLQDVNKWKYW